MKRFFKKLFCKHVYRKVSSDPNILFCVKCTKEIKSSNPDKVTVTKTIPANTVVKIYENTPTFKNGEICIILDYDSINKAYAVAPLRYTEKFDNDIFSLLEKQSKWVKPEFFEIVDYKKGTPKYVSGIILFLVGISVGLAITSMVGTL